MMINKQEIVKHFNEEEINEAIKIYEKYVISYEKDITMFINKFYPPNIWSFFEANASNNFKIETNGIFEECERRIISFNNIYNMEYPIRVIKITNKSNFSNLKHKDYLGGLLSLGIERNTIGDIVIRNESAYVPVVEDIYLYILNNLNKIGKSPVDVKLIEQFDEIPKSEFEEFIINVSSLRLDSIIAKICNVSRSKAIDLIESSRILLNYSKVNDKSKEITDGSRLTIRGNGKYIIGNIVGETKSGKQKVQIRKYI